MSLNIIVDIEATCWNDKTHRWVEQEIIEIGGVLWCSNCDTIKLFDYRCKPHLCPTLSQFCKDLTGITQADVDEAQYFLPVYTQLRQEMATFASQHGGDNDSSFRFMSWGDWDVKQLMLEFARRQLPYPFSIYTAVNIKDVFWKKHDSKSGSKGLPEALSVVGEKFTGNQHYALADAYNAFLAYRIATDLPFINQTWILQEELFLDSPPRLGRPNAEG